MLTIIRSKKTTQRRQRRQMIFAPYFFINTCKKAGVNKKMEKRFTNVISKMNINKKLSYSSLENMENIM